MKIPFIHKKSTFAFHKVVRRHYSGEVGEFRIFYCKISSDSETVYRPSNLARYIWLLWLFVLPSVV